MTVYIVGAGPGDPELLTLKADRLIKEANVILYDSLVNSEILDKAKEGCLKIFVGKRGGYHFSTQEETNVLLVKYGKIHESVVRLKGGDPFLFGRGGEESEVLASEGIPFEIVPGIPSPIAVPAYAGIPVTHRDFNSEIAIITGQKSLDNKDKMSFHQFPKVVIVLMGVKKRKLIAEEMIQSGNFYRDTPVAVIQNGTRLEQKVIITTLEELGELSISPPAIFVIGDVVKLREKLMWFENKLQCIQGKKILVSRLVGQETETLKLLESLKAVPVFEPLIKLQSLDFELPNLDDFDSLVFTSKNGIREFLRKAILPKDKKYYSIGPKTKKELELHGINSSHASKYNSIALGEYILSTLPEQQRILLIRSKNATDELRKILGQKHTVLTLKTYEVIPCPPEMPILRDLDVIFVTCGTAARAIVKWKKEISMLGITVVSIGPITTRVLQEVELKPRAEAKQHTILGMIHACVDYFHGKNGKTK